MKEQEQPKVTFGIINCNRLHYLKSCVESLIVSTSDYENKEIIIVDNASSEKGTNEYLIEKGRQGIKVFRQVARDPSNEFAKALNTITRESTGDYIAHLQGDMQFVINGGWLHEYVKFYENFKNQIGCVGLDAQRTKRNRQTSRFSNRLNDDYGFFLDYSRIPFSCSADVLYSKESLEFMGPFLEKNESHESGINSEDNMRKRIISKMEEGKYKIFCAMPLISPAAGIFTDARGTNARVRGNKRYGDYWEPKEDFKYYTIRDYSDILADYKDREIPVGIEELAIPIGWDQPVDSMGDWLKNPIRIESATRDDWEEIDPSDTVVVTDTKSPSYLDEWLGE